MSTETFVQLRGDSPNIGGKRLRARARHVEDAEGNGYTVLEYCNLISSPSDPTSQAEVTRTAPAINAPGVVARLAGPIELGPATLAILASGSNSGAGATINFPSFMDLGPTSLAALESISAIGPLTNEQLRAVPLPIDFPDNFAVTNFPNSFEISNFPAAFNVANFPASFAITNTNFEISNFPAAFSINNFPATQPISGLVAVSNFPATQAISNFPATQPVSGTVGINNFPATQAISNFPATQPISGAVAVSNFPATQAVTVNNFPATQPVSGPVTDQQLRTSPIILQDRPTISVTATAAANAVTTLTIPAPAIGQFVYLVDLEIMLYSTAARTGVAAPIIVTSTNLPGNPAWNFATAGAIGTIDRWPVPIVLPLKANTAASVVTIVGPAVANGIWRINARYYTGA